MLKSQVGKRVKFDPPRGKPDGASRKGKVRAEVWEHPLSHYNNIPVHTNCGHECWGDYAYCSQLLEWEQPGRKPYFSIRLGYCHRLCKKASWPLRSQTTLEMYPRDAEALLRKTLAMTEWFARPGRPAKKR